MSSETVPCGQPLEKEMAVFLPGESHGQRALGGSSPEGSTESDMI